MSLIWSEAQQAYVEDNGMEKYLGDGLYASFDGHGITLRAPRFAGHHYVYLEPQVIDAFEEYISALKAAAEERVKAKLTSAERVNE